MICQDSLRTKTVSETEAKRGGGPLVPGSSSCPAPGHAPSCNQSWPTRAWSRADIDAPIPADTRLSFSTFPAFVPSLSWQVFMFQYARQMASHKKTSFSTGNVSAPQLRPKSGFPHEVCSRPSGSCKKTVLFDFTLCLSRACLGKTIVYMLKTDKKHRFLTCQ